MTAMLVPVTLLLTELPEDLCDVLWVLSRARYLLPSLAYRINVE
jgi:hypothetical protein